MGSSLPPRCRGRKRKLFGDEAGIGVGGSDRDWYYGCKLMLAATDQGVITGFLLSPASTEDRWAAPNPPLQEEGIAFNCVTPKRNP